MEVKININSTCRISLTPCGKDVLRKRCMDDAAGVARMTRPGYKSASGEELLRILYPGFEEGVITIQLWQMMNIFGPRMVMGTEPVIEGYITVMEL